MGDQIRERVIRLLADELGIKADRLRVDTRLFHDLGDAACAAGASQTDYFGSGVEVLARPNKRMQLAGASGFKERTIVRRLMSRRS